MNKAKVKSKKAKMKEVNSRSDQLTGRHPELVSGSDWKRMIRVQQEHVTNDE